MVERRAVTLLARQDGLAVIGKGLAAGERVVVGGQYRLANGTKVKAAAAEPMNISESFIRRPIATALLMAGLLVFGVASYALLPVAALPNVDFPTIEVRAQLPGASPDTMASSVATPLEQQFAAIPGLAADVVHERPREHLDHPAIRPQPRHRRRGGRRAGRDQRRRRPAAEEPAEPADLQEDQSGGPFDPDLRGHLGRHADRRCRSVRLQRARRIAVAHSRRLAGRHRRPADAGGACAGQPGRARRARHRPGRRPHRAGRSHHRPAEGQPRRQEPAIHPRHQRPVVRRRCVPPRHRRLPQRRAGRGEGRRRRGQLLDQSARTGSLVRHQARRIAAHQARSRAPTRSRWWTGSRR